MIKKIVEHLIEKGYVVEEGSNKIITTHSVKGKQFKVQGELGNDFPFNLPSLFLLERNKFDILAHVTWNFSENIGIICTGVSVSRNIDYANPEFIYEKCLKDAVETLKISIGNSIVNNKEIIEEFNAHWRSCVNDQHAIINFVEPKDKIMEVKVAISSKKQPYVIDYDSKVNNQYKFLRVLEEKSQVSGKGIYFPLNKGILPPSPRKEIKSWWKNLIISSPSLKAYLKRFTRRNKSKVFWVVSSVNVNSKVSWFCLKFEAGRKEKLPLGRKDDFSKWNITPYETILHNKDFILPRGGASNSDRKQNILLVGCGSLGSEIANELVSTGLIEKLTLIDFDKMEPENIHRHFLGGKYIGESKAKALRNELRKKYPYIKIDYGKKKKLSECIDKKFLNDIDGVIVATGDPTAERYFNKELFKFEKRPWVIYSWLEGHGVGGHAVYVHNNGNGCLSCLYRNENGERSLNSIQNFIKGGQKVSVDISGCGSHFLPYSYLDAKETATLTSRLAIKALTGKLNESKRVSWKGDIDTSLGLETTYRYKNFKENFYRPIPLHWKGCDICND